MLSTIIKKYRHYLLIILFAITQFSFAYEQPDVVGIVIGGNLYDAESYEFESNNPSSFLYKYYPQLYKFKFIFLYAGDKITVLKDNVQLIIVLGGTEEVVIKKENSPYLVKKMEESSIWCNFVGIFGVGACVPSEPDTPETKVVTTTKGNPQVTSSEGQNQLELNLLSTVEPNPHFLLTGKRPLYLSWQGGKSPYVIRVSKIDDNCEQVADFLVTQAQSVKTQEIEFKRGTSYQIVIEDSDQKSVSGQFSVVEESIDYPSELDGMHESIREIMKALWLNKNDKNYSFEAYQRIVKIDDDEKNNPLAKESRTLLEKQ